MMPSGWAHDVFKLGPGPLPLAVSFRLGVAVGVPLLGGLATGNILGGMIAASCALLVTLADIGTTRAVRVGTMFSAGLAILTGGTTGSLLGGTTYADEALVLLSAFIAGWVSASHPGVATVARFCLITFSGLHASDTLQQALPTFSREMTSFQLDKASVFKSSGLIRLRFARTVKKKEERFWARSAARLIADLRSVWLAKRGRYGIQRFTSHDDPGRDQLCAG
jgi:hypothetical protein